MSILTPTLDNKHSSVIAYSKELKGKKEAGVTSFSNLADTEHSFKALNLELTKVDNPDLQMSLAQGIQPFPTPKGDLGSTFNSTSHGYSVDTLGFMGADFNKAAGLPENFKIHKSTLDEIDNFNQNSLILSIFSDNKKIYDNIDMADTIKQYYHIFTQVTADLKNKDVYSVQDISSLPVGFSSTGISGISLNPPNHHAQTMMIDRTNEKVSQIFHSMDKLNEAQEVSNELGKNGVKFHVTALNFSAKSMINPTNAKPYDFNPDMSVYDRDDGFSKEAVFMSFLKSVKPYALDAGNTKLSDFTLSKTRKMADETYNFLKAQEKINKDIQTMKDYLNIIVEKNLLDKNSTENAKHLANILNPNQTQSI